MLEVMFSLGIGAANAVWATIINQMKLESFMIAVGFESFWLFLLVTLVDCVTPMLFCLWMFVFVIYFSLVGTICCLYSNE